MRNANLDVKSIPKLIAPALVFVRRYMGLIFVVALALLIGFLVFQINSLATHEPSDADISDKLQAVQRPRIDQAVIDKIKQLQDQNVDTKTLFQKARDNPFSE